MDMNDYNVIAINDMISYISSSKDPLSSDIGIIKYKSEEWLFDVGADSRAISELPSVYNIVLSHFHKDHIANLSLIAAKKIFSSAETLRHIGRGKLVNSDVYNGSLHIFPIPSSHCKGCIGLEVEDSFAFVGDALYSKFKDGYYIYNTTLLKDEIEVLKSLKAPSLLVSHYPGLVRSRFEVIEELREIYSRRDKNDPFIKV